MTKIELDCTAGDANRTEAFELVQNFMSSIRNGGKQFTVERTQDGKAATLVISCNGKVVSHGDADERDAEIESLKAQLAEREIELEEERAARELDKTPEPSDELAASETEEEPTSHIEWNGPEDVVQLSTDGLDVTDEADVDQEEEAAG